MPTTSGENTSIDQITEVPQGVSTDTTSAEQAAQPKSAEQVAQPAQAAPPEGTKPKISVTKEDPKQSTESPVTGNDDGDFDWFETRVLNPQIKVESLNESIGQKGFKKLKAKEEYWKDEKIRNAFTEAYGSYAKANFNEAYANSSAEFARFQLGQFQKSQTAYELARDSKETFKVALVDHAATLSGAVAYKDTWVDPTRDIRQAFNSIEYRKEDGTYVIEDYSPELLAKLKQTKGFDGLAYTEDFFSMDPNSQVAKVHYTAIYDGHIKNSKGVNEVVKQANVVSIWDLDTGPADFGLFKVNLGKALANNKLQADSIGDYAKILVRAPLNMAVNVLDTGVQIARATLAGGYGVYKLFNDDGKDLRELEAFKFLSNKGIGLKAAQTSSTTEALKDGFFFSAEAALTTVSDIALQVALAGALGRAGAGGARIINSNLSGHALKQAEKRAAEITVRSTLTALSVKDTYNDAIENGYTSSEAAVITGAMGIAMWKATSFSDYITGSYSDKLLRQNIRSAMQAEHRGLMRTLFERIGNAAEDAAEQKAQTAFKRVQDVVKKVFEKATALPTKQYMYEARQEALEEMTEELFSDGIKQVASAYGALINGANQAGKGRYSSIFDEGYFKDAVERYATSGVAGGFGGVIGNVGNRVALDPITSSSTLTEIMLDGKKHELISVLKEMKDSGAFGPTTLSAKYNDALESFDPLLAGSGEASLPEVIYNNFLHDINVVEAFTKKSVFTGAQKAVKKAMATNLEDNSLRKDYVKLMSNLLEYHNSTNISTAIYDELDAMSEEALEKKIPLLVEEKITEQKAKLETLKATAAASAAKTSSTSSTNTAGAAKDDDDEEKGTEDIVLRLEKEAALSGKVSKETIKAMLENYRKVRAIANGSASEHYLINNIVGQNAIFGNKQNRDPKYEMLGETPFTDMLTAMRVKAIKLEQEQVERNIKSEEVSADIKAISTATKDGVDKIKDILSATSITLLSKDAIDHILSLYESSEKFESFQEAFSPIGKSTLLPASPTDDDYMMVALELLNLDPYLTTPIDISVFNGDATAAREIVETVATQDIEELKVPYLDNDGYVEYTDLPLVKSIDSGNSSLLKDALNLVPAEIKELKALYDSAVVIKQNKTFFTPVIKTKPSVSTVFYSGDSTELGRQTLETLGLSQVREFLESGIDNIYTYSDSKPITNIIEQMGVREAFMELLDSFIPKNDLEGLLDVATFRQFRINTLGIIDKKYADYVLSDTDTEAHSYKDYTKTSDFFSDFIYDPILFSDVMLKDPLTHTKEDKEHLDKLKIAKINLNGAIVIDTTKPLDDPNNINVLDDSAALDMLVQSIVGEDIKNAEAILRSTTLKTIQVNDANGNPVNFLLDGALRFKLAKALFVKTKSLIDDIANTTTSLPYNQDKKKSIDATFKNFTNVIAASKELENEIVKIIPTYKASTDPLFTLEPVDKAKLNLAIEQAFYSIYNNTTAFPMEKGVHDALVSFIDEYLKTGVKLIANRDNLVSSVPFTDYLELVTAFTTDLSPFYSKLKGYLETIPDDGKLLIASQEAAAKTAAAFIYSAPLREKLKELKISSRSVIESDFSNMLYVSGAAGAGKSSTTSEFGARLGTEIAEAMGQTNTAAWAIAPNVHQVDIIAGSLGSLTKGVPGSTFSEAMELINKAVVDNDQDALNQLSTIGVIVIDEVTYINGVDELAVFGRLVEKLAAIRGQGPIPIIIMGDKNQTTLTSEEGASLDITYNNTHATGYLNYSFRGRNNLLVASINAITEARESMGATSSGVTADMILKKGLVYGESKGRLYGVNITTPTDIDSEQGFLDVANDDDLIANIQKNIAKNKADNAALPHGEKEIPFSVLVAPHDMVSFMNQGTKLKALMADPETASYFKLVAADTIGGLEANYVLAELYSKKSAKNTASVGYAKNVGKKLNTIVTRPFDYVHVVNRTDIVAVPAEASPEKASEGSVIIPSTRMDEAAKKALIKFYLEIFSDIQTTTPVVPVVPTASVKKEVEESAEIDSILLDLNSKAQDTIFLAGISNLSIQQLKDIQVLLTSTDTYFKDPADALAFVQSASDYIDQFKGSTSVQEQAIATYLIDVVEALGAIDKGYSKSPFAGIQARLKTDDFLYPALADLQDVIKKTIAIKYAPSAGSNIPPSPGPPPPAGRSRVVLRTASEIATDLGLSITLRDVDVKNLSVLASATSLLYTADGDMVTDTVTDPKALFYRIDATGNVIGQAANVKFNYTTGTFDYDVLPLTVPPTTDAQDNIKYLVTSFSAAYSKIKDSSDAMTAIKFSSLLTFKDNTNDKIANILYGVITKKVYTQLASGIEDVDYSTIEYNINSLETEEKKTANSFLESVYSNFVEWLSPSPDASLTAVYHRILKNRDTHGDLTAPELLSIIRTYVPSYLDPAETESIYAAVVAGYMTKRTEEQINAKTLADAKTANIAIQKTSFTNKVTAETSMSVLHSLNEYLTGRTTTAPAKYITELQFMDDPADAAELKKVVFDAIYTLAQTTTASDALRDLSILLQLVGINTALGKSKDEIDTLLSENSKLLENLDEETMLLISSLYDKALLHLGTNSSRPAGPSSAMDGINIVRGFLKRLKETTQTLENYQAAVDSVNAGYTVGVTSFNERTLAKLGINIVSKDSIADWLSKQSLVDTFKEMKLELLLSKNNNGSVDVILLASEAENEFGAGVKTAIGQLSTIEKTSPAVLGLLQGAKKTMESAPAGATAIINTGAFIGDALSLRPGKIKAIVPGKDVLRLSEYSRLVDVMQNVNVSEGMFIQTGSAGTAVSASEDVLDMQGETFVVYSASSNNSINSKAVLSEFNKGQTNEQNLLSVDENGMKKGIGLVRAVLRPPLTLLQDYMLERAEDTSKTPIVLGEFTSILSLSLQKSFLDKYEAVLSSTEEFVEVPEYPGGSIKIKMEQFISEYKAIKTDYDRYFSSRSSTNSEKVQKAMANSLATLNAEQKAFFDILSNHLAITIVSKYSTEQKAKYKGLLLSWRSAKFGAIFNFDNIIKNFPKAQLEIFDGIMTQFNTPIKFSKVPGPAALFGSLDPDLVTRFKEYIYVPIDGIESPVFTVVEKGISTMLESMSAGVDNTVESVALRKTAKEALGGGVFDISILTDEYLDNLFPSNALEAEISNELMTNDEARARVKQFLNATRFSIPSHQEIYEQILDFEVELEPKKEVIEELLNYLQLPEDIAKQLHSNLLSLSMDELSDLSVSEAIKPGASMDEVLDALNKCRK